MLRASLQYGQRRYDNYVQLPLTIQDPVVNDAAYRYKDLANRDRTKGMVSWAVDVTKQITITPNGGFLYDNYQTNVNFVPGSEFGLKKVNTWNAGADATWNATRDLAFFVSYNFEDGYRQVFENASPPLADVNTRDQNHTVIFGSKITIIPAKLFLDVNYTYAYSISEWNLGCTPAGCQYTPLATYPDVHNRMNRFDVQAKYNLDDWFLRSAGFAGKAYLKARVLWEKNTNNSWQSLQNQLGLLVLPTPAATQAYSVWMGTGNPNYNVVVGMVSLGVNW